MRESRLWINGEPGTRYRIIVAIWLMLFVTMVASNYSGWRLLGALDQAALILLAVIGYFMLVVFRRGGAAKSPWSKSPWSVAVMEGEIRTSDGQSAEHVLPISAIRRVVVATDDSGPWGDDVVFLLFTEEAEPVGIFPLEARGCQDFVGWLSRQPGYRDRELAKAMGSTSVARFEVLSRPADQTSREKNAV